MRPTPSVSLTSTLPDRAGGRSARKAAALLAALLMLSAAAAEGDAVDAVTATRAREIARVSDPKGTAWLNQAVGIVLLPASLIILLFMAAKGRP